MGTNDSCTTALEFAGSLRIILGTPMSKESKSAMLKKVNVAPTSSTYVYDP